MGGGLLRLLSGLGVGLVEDDGFADDFGPGVVEGLHEFLSGEFLGLEHELAEVSESDSGLGLDESEGGDGKEGGESGAEIAGGEDVSAEELIDLDAGFLGADVVRVFLGVEVAEAHVVGGWRHLAAEVVGEEKHTLAGAVLVNGHGSSPEKLDF